MFLHKTHFVGYLNFFFADNIRSLCYNWYTFCITLACLHLNSFFFPHTAQFLVDCHEKLFVQVSKHNKTLA